MCDPERIIKRSVSFYKTTTLGVSVTTSVNNIDLSILITDKIIKQVITFIYQNPKLYILQAISYILQKNKGGTPHTAAAVLFIYIHGTVGLPYPHTHSFIARPPIINYIWYMDYFGLDDVESVAYVDKDSNDVIIKFVGFPNELASQLFINYVMLCIGFDFEPTDSMPSKKIH